MLADVALICGVILYEDIYRMTLHGKNSNGKNSNLKEHGVIFLVTKLNVIFADILSGHPWCDILYHWKVILQIHSWFLCQ